MMLLRALCSFALAVAVHGAPHSTPLHQAVEDDDDEASYFNASDCNLDVTADESSVDEPSASGGSSHATLEILLISLAGCLVLLVCALVALLRSRARRASAQRAPPPPTVRGGPPHKRAGAGLGPLPPLLLPPSPSGGLAGQGTRPPRKISKEVKN